MAAWSQDREGLHLLPSWFPWRWRNNRAISYNFQTPDMLKQFHLSLGTVKKSGYARIRWSWKQGLRNIYLTPMQHGIPFWYVRSSLHQDSEIHTAKLHYQWIQISMKKHFLLSSLLNILQVPVYRMDSQLPVRSSCQLTLWTAEELTVQQFEA